MGALSNTEIVRYCTAILGIFINGGIVAAFLVQKVRRPSEVKVNPSGLLVLNLLVAVALRSSTTLLNLAAESTFIDTYTTWCIARISFSFLATIAPYSAILNVVIDRLVDIARPLNYHEWMTRRRSMVMVCCGWFIPVAGAVAVVIAAEDPQSLVASCFEINGYQMFLWSVWIPAHVLGNLLVIIIQCRTYSYLKRRDEGNVKILNSSGRIDWILIRVTLLTYVAMLLMYVMSIIIQITGNHIIQKIYPITLLVVHYWYLMNPLAYVYATDNVRRPVSDLCKDIRKCLCPAKDPLEPCV